MFRSMDDDGNGCLTFDEFSEFLPKLNIDVSETVAFQVFQTFDCDGEGSIDFTEFLLGVFPKRRYHSSASGFLGHGDMKI